MSEFLSKEDLLDHGVCAIKHISGNDFTPAEAARTSFMDNVDDYSEAQNSNLIDYLIRHEHSTPLEFPDVTFYMVAPIFVSRQLIRHRTFSTNEASARYVEMEEKFYIPAPERYNSQSKNNKQGSGDSLIEHPAAAWNQILRASRYSFEAYHTMLDMGLAKEIARSVLPLNTYTTWYWKANLRNVLHMLKLRLNPQVQYETRLYAESILRQLRHHFPTIISAWENHVLNAVTFSADEFEIIKKILIDTTTHKEGSYLRGTLNLEARQHGLRDTRRKEFVDKVV